MRLSKVSLRAVPWLKSCSQAPSSRCESPSHFHVSGFEFIAGSPFLRFDKARFNGKQLILEEPSRRSAPPGRAGLPFGSSKLDRAGPPTSLPPERAPGRCTPRTSPGRRGSPPSGRRGPRPGAAGRKPWRRSSPRPRSALPTWGSRLAGGRFRAEGGTRRSATSGARLSCRICRAQWRLHCFTRGCLEMQPLRPLG